MEFNFTEWPANSTEGADRHPVGESYTYIVLVIGVTIVIGHAITLLTIKVNPSFRTTPDMYLASLSTADLLIGVAIILSVSFNTSFIQLDRSGLVYKYVCLSSQCLAVASGMTSVCNLALVSLDRYMAISYPFVYRSHNMRRRTRSVLVGSWLCCFIYGLLIVYFNRFTPYSKCSFVILTRTWYRRYLTSSLILTFLTISVVCYIKIARVFLKTAKQFKTPAACSPKARRHVTKSTYECSAGGQVSRGSENNILSLENVREVTWDKRQKTGSSEEGVKRQKSYCKIQHLFQTKSKSSDGFIWRLSGELGPLVRCQSSFSLRTRTPVCLKNQRNATLKTSLDSHKDLHSARKCGYYNKNVSLKCNTREQYISLRQNQSNIRNDLDDHETELNGHKDALENCKPPSYLVRSLSEHNCMPPSIASKVLIQNSTNLNHRLSFSSQNILNLQGFLASQKDFLNLKYLSEQNLLLESSPDGVFHELTNGSSDYAAENESQPIKGDIGSPNKQCDAKDDKIKPPEYNEMDIIKCVSLPNMIGHPNLQGNFKTASSEHEDVEAEQKNPTEHCFKLYMEMTTKCKGWRQYQFVHKQKRSDKCFQSLNRKSKLSIRLNSKVSSSSGSRFTYKHRTFKNSSNVLSKAKKPNIKKLSKPYLNYKDFNIELMDKSQTKLMCEKQRDETDKTDVATYSFNTCQHCPRNIHIYDIPSDSCSSIESTSKAKVIKHATMDKHAVGADSQKCLVRHNFTISNRHRVRTEPTIARNALAKEMSRNSRNVIKIIFMTQVIFIVCFLPTTANFILYGLVPIPRWMVLVSNVLGLLNSVVNIFAYAASMKYRKAILSVLRCRFRTQRQ